MSKLVKRLKQAEQRKRKQNFQSRMDKLSNNEIADLFAKSNNSFLCSTEWRELRQRVLTHYGCVCMKCGKEPENRRHIHVDHIKPRKFFPELSLDFDNLQVLCNRCNWRKGNKNQTDYRQIL